MIAEIDQLNEYEYYTTVIDALQNSRKFLDDLYYDKVIMSENERQSLRTVRTKLDELILSLEKRSKLSRENLARVVKAYRSENPHKTEDCIYFLWEHGYPMCDKFRLNCNPCKDEKCNHAVWKDEVKNDE